MIVSRPALVFRPDVVATIVDDGAVLLDLESKYFYELNASGWAIASLFESGASLDDVIQRCETWGAGNAAEPEIRAFVEALVAENLVAPSELDSIVDAEPFAGAWESPRMRKQTEPLQRIMMSAFDPSVPLLE